MCHKAAVDAQRRSGSEREQGGGGQDQKQFVDHRCPV
jgi:hypothetical protein